MIESLKRLASRLPHRWQQALKRLWFGSQMRRGTFRTGEPEFDRLGEWVTPGDWALDIGANVGHYTMALARIVGERGRVLAFEPVPATFEQLAANAARLPYHNVSLFNVAVAAGTGELGMAIPSFADTGLVNYYEARVVPDGGNTSVLSLCVDNLSIPHRVAFVKIDVEGYELEVLTGMKALLARDHPVLVVEGTSPEVETLLEAAGYRSSQVRNSPNTVFTWQE